MVNVLFVLCPQIVGTPTVTLLNRVHRTSIKSGVKPAQSFNIPAVRVRFKFIPSVFFKSSSLVIFTTKILIQFN